MVEPDLLLCKYRVEKAFSAGPTPFSPVVWTRILGRVQRPLKTRRYLKKNLFCKNEPKLRCELDYQMPPVSAERMGSSSFGRARSASMKIGRPQWNPSLSEILRGRTRRAVQGRPPHNGREIRHGSLHLIHPHETFETGGQDWADTCMDYMMRFFSLEEKEFSRRRQVFLWVSSLRRLRRVVWLGRVYRLSMTACYVYHLWQKSRADKLSADHVRRRRQLWEVVDLGNILKVKRMYVAGDRRSPGFVRGRGLSRTWFGWGGGGRISQVAFEIEGFQCCP